MVFCGYHYMAVVDNIRAINMFSNGHLFPGVGLFAAMSSESEDAPQKRRLSCTKYFDALYFCYCMMESSTHYPPKHLFL